IGLLGYLLDAAGRGLYRRYPPAHRYPVRRIAASGYSPYPSIPIDP
ncbi:hypothetical protein H2N93_29880, partial [Pseudomonas aeruginosa]|nr:hypothetical protein [Pseudomonas aeruginosa]